MATCCRISLYSNEVGGLSHTATVVNHTVTKNHVQFLETSWETDIFDGCQLVLNQATAVYTVSMIIVVISAERICGTCTYSFITLSGIDSLSNEELSELRIVLRGGDRHVSCLDTQSE